MTKADELRALAAKVQQAEGPSRELDAEIANAIGMVEWVKDYGTPEIGMGLTHYIPTFSASVDAALMLAPICAGDTQPTVHLWTGGICKAVVFSDEDTGRKGLGRTPALAITAAAAVMAKAEEIEHG